VELPGVGLMPMDRIEADRTDAKTLGRTPSTM
jgi:hypothetical protein